MPRVTLAGSKRIRLEGGRIPSSLRDLNGVVPSTFPLCGDIIRRFQEANTEVVVDASVRRALKPMLERQNLLLGLRELEDAEWGIHGERLYPFQRVGARWLLAAERGILADSQGLGKTVQALVAAEAARPRRAIIVCNDSKIRDWVDHIREWTTRTPLVLRGGAAERERVLASWRDEFLVCNFTQTTLNAGLHADMLIVDEAHNIRNRKTQIFRAIENLSLGARWVFLLTASPTVNRAEDIWSLLHIVDGDRFRSYWSFACRFFEIRKERRGAQEVVVVGGIRDDERAALDRILSVYMLQRGKDQLKGLPTRTRRVVEYVMSPEQARLHREMLLNEEARFGSQVVQSEGALSQFTRLRQLAIDPGLLFDGYTGGSKIDLLVRVLAERTGGKTVVFTMFEQAARRVEERLKDEGVHAVLLTGSMDNRSRDNAIREFADSADVLVVTHKTGGEGLNLVMAQRAVFLDLAWHPAGNTHAEDRIYRIGQKANEVETVVLKSKGSIEEHIFDIISQKRDVTIEEILRRAKDAERQRKDRDTQPESADRNGVSPSVVPWIS